MWPLGAHGSCGSGSTVGGVSPPSQAETATAHEARRARRFERMRERSMGRREEGVIERHGVAGVAWTTWLGTECPERSGHPPGWRDDEDYSSWWCPASSTTSVKAALRLRTERNSRWYSVSASRSATMAVFSAPHTSVGTW